MFFLKKYTAITAVSIILICFVTLFAGAKTTVIFDDTFAGDNPPYSEGNALGWSYNIEKEDIANPNEIFHVRNAGYIKVEMNNAAEHGEFGNQWFTEVRYQGITLKGGVEYTLNARLVVTGADTNVMMKLDKMAAPYSGPECPRNYSDSSKDPMKIYSLTQNDITDISFTFTPEKDYYGVKFALLFDGSLITNPEDLPFAFNIYNASLIAEGPDDVEVPVPNYLDNGIAEQIKVNHLGYLPKSKKIGYYSHPMPGWYLPEERDPKPFTIYDSEDNPVYEGFTEDIGSRYELVAKSYYNHIMDFSDFTDLGNGYYIKMDGTDYVSQPFDIANNIYAGMADDALNYFYYNRSGIEINLGDESQHRPAGHPGDEAKYSFDTYDVEGGWYDAGDFGKYTVTGSYSIWMLLNLYEQYAYEVNGLIPEDADGENGINDLLDEAKYELDFLFKMQVPPEGINGTGSLAGAVFCKIVDSSWTSVPVMPYDSTEDIWYEEKDRVLFKPTIAATLDFIAVMAQAWRIWRDLDDNDTGEDDVFAIKCRDAALAAYAAYDDVKDNYWTTTEKYENGGGGPYDDIDARDECYWALIELYISSGDAAYIESSLFTELDADTEGDYYGFKEMRIHYLTNEEDGVADLPHSWKNVSGCGVMSLYAAKDKIDNPEMISAVEASIIALADVMYDKVIDCPFGIAISLKSEIFWGSNQTVANRALLMSCAYEITGDDKYLEGVSRAMDYLLGTNPLDVSYISGYGERFPKNVHHRFWAGPIDQRFPYAPAGCLVGGSNPTQYNIFQDEYKDEINIKSHDPFVILGKIYKTNYLTAYVDSYESYSTNEVTINWNAALVCLAAVADNMDAYKEDIEGLLDDVDTGEMVLTPDFQDDVFTYSSTVDHEVDSISITPTAIDDDSIIYVNGVLVESGEPSQEIDLVVGINTITIYVENTEGDSVTYIINITREEAPAVIVLTDQNTDNRNYTVNDELTFQILTGGSGVIQISSVVPYPSQVTVSINGGPYQPTPELWGGPFYVPANTNVIFKVKAAVPTDIVLNWW